MSDYVDIRSIDPAERAILEDCAQRIPRDWNFRMQGPVTVMARTAAPEHPISAGSMDLEARIDTRTFRMERLYRAGVEQLFLLCGNVIVR
jgi:hypothetical protein